MSHLVWLIIVGAYGACLGSFLNVVIYRLPEGRSLVHPGSRCPACGHAVVWYDNVPVLSWVLLGGHCRYCRAPISIQYPIIEGVTALLFVGLYWLYYMSGLHPEFTDPGLLPLGDLMATWPVLLVHMGLLAGLLAASVIDARHYIIPLAVTTTLALLAAIVYPLGTMLQALPTGSGLHVGAKVPMLAPLADTYYLPPFGHVGLNICGMIVGALAGLLVANGLLRLGVIPRSFEDEGTPPLGHGADVPAPGAGAGMAAASAGIAEPAAETQEAASGGSAGSENQASVTPENHVVGAGKSPDVPEYGTPEQWLAYPHARREVLIELLFLGWPVLGALLGNALLPVWRFHPTPAHVPFALALLVLMGVAGGYLVGGTVVWVTRIVGTLAFGKEAMGLGDVHLMAAIGAVLGWQAVLLAFFLAPFGGILGTVVILGLRRVGRRQGRVVPYGPYLALAAVLTLAFQGRILGFLGLPHR